jgi:hypothetical protein
MNCIEKPEADYPCFFIDYKREILESLFVQQNSDEFYKSNHFESQVTEDLINRFDKLVTNILNKLNLQIVNPLGELSLLKIFKVFEILKLKSNPFEIKGENGLLSSFWELEIEPCFRKYIKNDDQELNFSQLKLDFIN